MELLRELVQTLDLSGPLFLCGVIGAGAPEVLRWWRLRESTHRPKSWWHYLFSTVFFLVIGGFFAGVGAKNAFGALFMGVTWPTTVAVWLGQPLPSNPAKGDPELTFRQYLGLLLPSSAVISGQDTDGKLAGCSDQR